VKIYFTVTSERHQWAYISSFKYYIFVCFICMYLWRWYDGNCSGYHLWLCLLSQFTKNTI